MHNITTKFESCDILARTGQQKKSHLDLLLDRTQRDNNNREEILDRTLEENHSSGEFSTLLIEKMSSTIYRNYYMKYLGKYHGIPNTMGPTNYWNMDNTKRGGESTMLTFNNLNHF